MPVISGPSVRLRTQSRVVAHIDAPVLAVERVFADVVERYDEPHRRYHTLGHVDHLLRVAEALSTPEVDERALVLAAVWHDVIYDPQALDNERRSAELAQAHLRELGVGQQVIFRVAELIDATAEHVPAVGDVTAATLIDADLSSLAAPTYVYDQVNTAIRAEYAHLDDRQWAEGRSAFIERFLGRERIFHTANGHARYEDVARENLLREADQLRKTGT